MRTKITGTCLAFNNRAEAFLLDRPYGTVGRFAWCKKPKSKPEIRPFKERRAQRGTRAPFFQHRRTMPHLSSRIERAHRVMDPLHGYHSLSEIMETFGDTTCHMVETKENDWVFRGQKGRVEVTIITPPLSVMPTAGTQIKADSVPVTEVYLQNGHALLACSQTMGPVRFNQNEITV